MFSLHVTIKRRIVPTYASRAGKQSKVLSISGCGALIRFGDESNS